MSAGATTCPSWCTTDHAAEAAYLEPGQYEPIHSASFGAVELVEITGTEVTVEVAELAWIDTSWAQMGYAAAALRGLAADALAAAEWIEAHG